MNMGFLEATGLAPLPAFLTSLALAHYHSQNWLWVTAFVGFNLLQSSITKFCPLEIVLKKLGGGGSCCS